MEKTLLKDHAKSVDDSYIEIHKRLRDGDLATADNAREFVKSIFGEERYDFSRVGRVQFNRRFNKKQTEEEFERQILSLMTLSPSLIISVF